MFFLFFLGLSLNCTSVFNVLKGQEIMLLFSKTYFLLEKGCYLNSTYAATHNLLLSHNISAEFSDGAV